MGANKVEEPTSCQLDTYLDVLRLYVVAVKRAYTARTTVPVLELQDSATSDNRHQHPLMDESISHIAKLYRKHRVCVMTLDHFSTLAS